MNEQFEAFILALIQDECTRDKELREMTEQKKNKNPKECAKYVLQEAYKMAEKNRNGQMGSWCGIDNEPIVNLIIHYYTEDSIKVEDLPSNVKVVSASKAEKKPKTEVPKPMPKTEPKPVVKPKKEEKKKNVVQLDLFDVL